MKPCLRTKNQVNPLIYSLPSSLLNVKIFQIWYETDLHELVLAQLLCLDTGTASNKPKLSKCHELKGSQEWKHPNKVLDKSSIEMVLVTLLNFHLCFTEGNSYL